MLVNHKLILQKLFKTKLGRGSLIMIVGSMVVGALSFIFNPIMGVMLGVERYAEVLSLLSLQIIFSVPTLTANAVLIKYTASFKGRGELGQIRTMLLTITKFFSLVSIFTVLIFLLISQPLADFLQIKESYLILLLGFVTIVTVFFNINGSFLQGLLNFQAYTLLTFLTALLRVVFSVGLVYAGLAVGGAMWGIILAGLASYVASWYFLNKELVAQAKANIYWRGIIQFVLPAFLSNLGLVLLNNLDVVLVKHFFTATEAGHYSAGVLTSRLIIFASLPITQILFPLVTQRYENKKRFHHLVLFAIVITLAIGLSVSSFYFLFPELVIKIFFLGRSTEYLGAGPLLGIFGIYVLFYAINTLLTFLFLSLHKVKFSVAPLIAGLVEGVIIWFYHPNLESVVWVAISTNAILTLALTYYYIKQLKS